MGIALSRSAAALDRLFARTTGASRLGLERTAALLDLIGNPHRDFASFHVAGTNGKGSTVATIDALLRRPGRKVGRYTSPHLVDFRERILVDGAAIPDDAVAEFLDTRMPDIERTGATFFEATTAMAFDWFRRAGADVAVVETGLGGRLDATNVLQPVVAAVTSIGIDHTDYLGSTIEEIAGEKAGIFKSGLPAVIGEANPVIRHLLLSHARTRGASPVTAATEDWVLSEVDVAPTGTSFTLQLSGERRRYTTPLVGEHQASNAATALATVRAAGPRWMLSSAEAANALARVWLPGRFHRHGKFIFDVAHNPAGAATLAQTIVAASPARPVVALVTVLRDKDWLGILTALAGAVDAFVLTSAPTVPASRAWDVEQVRVHAAGAGLPVMVVEDFDEALRLVGERGETVLVTGSFHTVGDAMARLRVSPLAR